MGNMKIHIIGHQRRDKAGTIDEEIEAVNVPHNCLSMKR